MVKSVEPGAARNHRGGGPWSLTPRRGSTRSRRTSAALHNPGLRETLCIDARALGEACGLGPSSWRATSRVTYARPMDERELFTEHFDLDPESVWTAFKRGTATMDLRDVDDVNRTARLSTGVTLNGWHDELFATVAPGASGTDLVVRGRSKNSPLGSEWGKDFKAHGVQKAIRAAVKQAMVA